MTFDSHDRIVPVTYSFDTYDRIIRRPVKLNDSDLDADNFEGEDADSMVITECDQSGLDEATRRQFINQEVNINQEKNVTMMIKKTTRKLRVEVLNFKIGDKVTCLVPKEGS